SLFDLVPVRATGQVARMFEHKAILNAANRIKATHKRAEADSHERHLWNVPQTFIELQQGRELADYDWEATIDVADATYAISLAEQAFANWQLIREQQIAQAFLFPLLSRERPPADEWSKSNP